MAGSHIGTAGDRYRSPRRANQATRRALDNPDRENIVHYLHVHIDDRSLAIDELVDYVHRARNWSPAFIEAGRQSVRACRTTRPISPASGRPSS
jgi:hypothetical protein